MRSGLSYFHMYDALELLMPWSLLLICSEPLINAAIYFIFIARYRDAVRHYLPACIMPEKIGRFSIAGTVKTASGKNITTTSVAPKTEVETTLWTQFMYILNNVYILMIQAFLYSYKTFIRFSAIKFICKFVKTSGKNCIYPFCFFEHNLFYNTYFT